MSFIKTRLSELAKSIPMVRSYLLRQGVFRNPDESWRSEVVSIVAASCPLDPELSDELIDKLKSDPNGKSFLLPLIFQMDLAMDHEGLIIKTIEKHCHSKGTEEGYIQKTYDDVIAPCLRSSCSANTKEHSVYQYLNNVPLHPDDGKPWEAQISSLQNLICGDICQSGMFAIIDGSNKFLEEKGRRFHHGAPTHQYVRFFIPRTWSKYAECVGAAYFEHALELMRRSLSKDYAATGILCTFRESNNVALYDTPDMLEALEEFLTNLDDPNLKQAVGLQVALANSRHGNIRNPNLRSVIDRFWKNSLTDSERSHASSQADRILGSTRHSQEGSGSKGKRGSGELA
jgi:hypothetical protein